MMPSANCVICQDNTSHPFGINDSRGKCQICIQFGEGVRIDVVPGKSVGCCSLMYEKFLSFPRLEKFEYRVTHRDG